MDTPSAPRASPQDNAVNISGQSTVEVHGDLFGGNKYIGYNADQVRVLLADIRASYQLKSFDGRSPYVGLASFQEQDADRFFGREKLTTELVARIEHTRFLVIAGPSGSGKSSVARAGLMHTLRKGVQLNALTNAPTGTENWLYEILTPGRNPLTELARVVSSFTGKLQAGDELVNRGREDATLLHRWADIALGDQKTRRAILLVDQFEEVFTQVTDESERAAFLNLLVYAATAKYGRVTIVCCTRSDFIGNWVKYPNLNDLLRNGLYQIPPMQPDELVSAIARPALQVGLQIDPELVKQILDDMRDAPGALPLMQFALDDLFEYKKNQGGIIALTRDDYLARGGLHQALSRHADAAFAKLNPDEQKIARTIFAGLVEPGRGNVDTRRTVRLQEIVPADTDAAQVKNVITKLADARLVTTDKKDADETITLAHERLIDAWKWLRDLIDENREAIALKNKIDDDAKEWEQEGRNTDYLYKGAQLTTAQELLRDKKVALSALAQDFVDVAVWTQDRARRQEARRTRILIFAISAVAVIFAVLAGFAFTKQQEAEHQQRIARSRELAALARSEFDKKPDIAILIAAEANKDTDAITFESEDALRELLGKYPLQFVLRGKELGVQSTQFSHDGTRLVTASEDGKVQIWDAVSGKEISRLSGHVGPVMRAQFSHDDTRIVTVGCDKLDEIGSCVLFGARVWDVANGKSIAILNGHAAGVGDAQFSPNDKWILTTGCEETDESLGCAVGTARLWDVEASVSTGIGKQLAVINGQNVVSTAQFSPRNWQHGEQIVTIECVSSTPTQPNEVSSCYPKTTRVWNVKELGGTTEIQELAAVQVDDGWVIHTQFVSNDSSESIQVVTTDTDGQVSVRDAVSGNVITTLKGTHYDVTLAEISPDGKKIVTASSAGLENTARVWNMENGELIDTLTQQYHVTALQFSSDGSKLVTVSSDDQTARIWTVADLSNTFNRKEPLILNAQDYVASALFSPDSNQIVTTGPNHGAQVWDANGSKLFDVVRAHASKVTSAAYSRDGKLIVTAGCDKADGGNNCLDYSARVWDAETNNQLVVLAADDHQVLSAKFSPTSSLNYATILTIGCVKSDNGACISSTARIWKVSGLHNTKSEKQSITLAGHQEWVREAKFSGDGTRILTVGCEQVESGLCILGTARIWDAASGQSLAIIRDYGPLNSAEFSPDGSRVITAGCEQLERKACRVGSARIWDATSGKELVALHGHTDWVRTAQYSPDAKRVVTASRDGTARIWDAASGKELYSLKSHPFFYSAQFSPDGKQIAAVGTSGGTQIVDSANGRVIATIPTDRVVGIRFSSDSKRVLATIGVWDATTGKQLSNLHWDTVITDGMEFSPEGSKILAAGNDGMVRIYSIKVADLVTLAQKRIGRELECYEREQYLNEQNVCPTPTPEATPTP